MKINLLLSFLLFNVVPVVAQSNSPTAHLFPIPEALKDNVEFWKSIYAVHSERDIVIHDSEDLSIIYEVVNLDSLFRGINVSPRLEWKRIEAIKDEYQAILLKLSRQRKINKQQLTEKEKRVANLFKNDLSSRRLRRAASKIRAQNGLRERFKLGLQHSGLYLSKMQDIFRREGLPLELLVLPHVESSFNYKAYSKFGAAGLWQFTRSTGRLYMNISYEVDERFDPIFATEAAAQHLKRNYEALENWPLAITAYNHGRSGMSRAKAKYGADIGRIVQNYNSRSFGFASRNFYAEFLAALYVSTHYRDYFKDLELDRPNEYIVFEAPDFIPLDALLQTLNIGVDEFAEYNPALRPPVLQSKRRIPKNFRIRIPFRDDLNMTELYAQISSEFKFDEQVVPEWHKVRAGENLTVIASRYGVSLHELMALNNIRNPHRIFVGQNLQIPTSENVFGQKFTAKVEVEKPTQLAEVSELLTKDEPSILDVPQSIRIERADDLTETKSQSDKEVDLLPAKPKSIQNGKGPIHENTATLPAVEVQQIERQYESVEDVMAMALPEYHVELTKNLGPRVVKEEQVEFAQYSFRDLDYPENGQVRVEPDETLGHFADWLKVRTQRLREINRLSYWQDIKIGQRLLLTFENVTPEEFHRQRLEFHQSIEEDFYNNFDIVGQKLYEIKRGENIWVITNRTHEMPYWLIKKYNPKKDLFNLIAGEEIVVPVIEERFPESQLGPPVGD